VSDYSALSTDELRKMHGWFEHEVYNLEHEIKERTSPWPWPRSVQPFPIWRLKTADDICGLIKYGKADRARPNSGE
jgi:hypothetical protein